MDCTPGQNKVAVVEGFLIRVNVWTVHRAKTSGSVGEVAVTGGSTVLDGNFF